MKYCLTISLRELSLKPTINSMLDTTSYTDIPSLTFTRNTRLPTSARIMKSSLKFFVCRSLRS